MFQKSLYWLGLKFQDRDTESSYQQFKAETEDKLLNVANLLSTLLNGLNFVLGLLGSRQNIILRGIIFAISLIGTFIRRKAPRVSKAILVVTSLALFYVILVSIDKMIPFDLPESFFLVGNVFGLMELIFSLSLRNLWLRVSFSIVNFVLKMAILIDRLSDRTIARAIGMSAIYIGYYFYYETVERRNFKIIYESREKLKKFQSLLSNDFPSSVLVMASNFQSILYSNHFFRDMFGSSNDSDFIISLLEKFQIESCTPSLGNEIQSKCDLNSFLKTISSGPTSFPEKEVITLSAIFKNMASNSNNLYFEIKLRQIEWDSKGCYALVFHDVSDKQRILALKIADEHKDRVIATVSHELKTPINGILGLLRILSSKIVDETCQTYLSYCKSCSKLLLYLVNSILDLSQIRSNHLQLNKQYFSLDTFLEEMKTLYLFQTKEKGIEFIVSKSETVPNEIYTDKYRLIQILINLLGNAFKFTFEGKISLTVCEDSQNPNKLLFSVSDTGIGIKDEDKPKLFKMFGKLDPEDENFNLKGAGLGLTVTNELVKALNEKDEEKLNFTSIYGEGSSFYFRIRMDKDTSKCVCRSTETDSHQENQGLLYINEMEFDEASGRNIPKWKPNLLPSFRSRQLIAQETQEEELLTPKGLFYRNENSISPRKDNLTRNILVVDDNPFNILAATFVLQQLGCSVSKAMSGRECIQLLEDAYQDRRYYDLVLMDIQMPLMDGLEASKLINEKIQKGEISYVPIVAQTAHFQSEKIINSYKECGIVDYLSKPLKGAELTKVLDKWIMKKCS